MEEVGNSLFDGNYEAALRQAFFDVIRSHPKQAFETVVYFKPKRMIKVIFITTGYRWWDAARSTSLFIILQIAVFIAFISVRPVAAPLEVVRRQFCILALLIVPALAPQLLTFTAAPTAIDMLTYTLSGCAIVFWLVVSCAIQLMRRWPSNTRLRTLQRFKLKLSSGPSASYQHSVARHFEYCEILEERLNKQQHEIPCIGRHRIERAINSRAIATKTIDARKILEHADRRQPVQK